MKVRWSLQGLGGGMRGIRWVLEVVALGYDGNG